MTRAVPVVFLTALACSHAPARAPEPPASSKSAEASAKAASPTPPLPLSHFQVPVESYVLPNGLKVVLSPDSSAPLAVVGVYYHTGFRLEPRDRTGFAHLFEHMMFQGSQNLGKMGFVRLIQGNGGILNGSTRFDFTNYFEAIPSNTLETALWAEGDRMRGLNVTEENLKNQQGVVENEVRVNVLNRPYGGFPWLQMPQVANQNWHNAHNFYGDLKDLEAAKLTDVQAFFKQFYSPNNAALVVEGDFQPEQVKAWVAKYFGNIPKSPLPAPPDLTEPPQLQEKYVEQTDKLAQRPALAVGYHMPPRNSRAFWAMAMLQELLLEGRDSALYQELVQKRGLTGEVSGGPNLLGNQFDYEGPMLWTATLFHDSDKSPKEILAAIDAAIEPYRTTPIDAATLARTQVKARSRFYSTLEDTVGFGRVDLLASYALFDNDPAAINRIEPELMSVTPELIQATAKEWLRPTNRTVVALKPGAKS